MKRNLKGNWLRGACTAVASVAMFAATSAMASFPGAIWTSDPNLTVDKNIYTGSQCDVVLNGGPGGAGNNRLLGGLYYWQVTNPSGSITLSTSNAAGRVVTVPGPNEPNAGNFGGIPLCTFNLSPNSEYKAYLIKTFGSDCGLDKNGNPQVYIDQNDPTIIHFPSNCAKTDNFKFIEAAQCTPASPVSTTCPCLPDDTRLACQTVTPHSPQISLSKTAAGTYDEKWTWAVTKQVDTPAGCAVVDGKVRCAGASGGVTFNYTIGVTNDGGKASNTAVTGAITVSAINGNDTSGNPVLAQDVVVTDDGLKIASSGDADPNLTSLSCVLNGNLGTVNTGVYNVPYTCTYGAGGPADDFEFNLAEVSSSNAFMLSNSATSDTFQYVVTDIDNCVSVTDPLGGVSTQLCLDGNTIQYPSTFTFASGCVDTVNTATITTNTTSTSQSASQTVRVCGITKTGGLTIGFWSNKNGQGVLTHGSCAAAIPFLQTFKPFQDLLATTCSGLNSYVQGIIKQANASGATMNAMLKAQMLATALDVFFSSSAGGSAILPFNGNIANVGNFDVDLSKIWGNEDVRSSFGGANHLTVSAMLTYAASQSATVGGTNWYGQVKAAQGLAKDAFDAINNGVVIPW